MSIDDKCNHPSLFYTDTIELFGQKIPLYRCEDCRVRVSPQSVGGTLDTDKYLAAVVGYNGLRLYTKRGTQ